MKINMIRSTFLITVLLFLSVNAIAQLGQKTVSFVTYFAPPEQEFKRLRITDLFLKPQGQKPGNCEKEGAFYINQEDNYEAYVCKEDTGGTKRWSLFSGNIWKREKVETAPAHSNLTLYNPGIKDHYDQTNDAKLAIGTDEPLFTLTVGKVDSDTGNLIADGGIVAFGEMGNINSDRLPPTFSGASTNFIWYPYKAALRASHFYCGSSDCDYLDEDQIGRYSVAFGEKTKASGDGSFALGFETKASGKASVAMGSWTVASSAYSFASGLFLDTGEEFDSLAMLGICNEPFIDQNDSSTDDNPIFIIGNGEFVWDSSEGVSCEDTRNSFVVLRDGSVGIRDRDMGTYDGVYERSETRQDKDSFPLRTSNIFSSVHVLGDKIILEDTEPEIVFKTNDGPDDFRIIESYESTQTLQFQSIEDGWQPGSDPEAFGKAKAILVITSDDKVGINTANPQKTLHVVGNVYVNKIGTSHIDARGFLGVGTTSDACAESLVGQMRMQGDSLQGCIYDSTKFDYVWKSFTVDE